MSATTGGPIGAPLGGPSPVARGRRYLPGRVRAAGAIGCCVVAAGAVAWAVWPRPAAERNSVAGSAQVWNMGMTLPERAPVVIAPPLPPAKVDAAPALQTPAAVPLGSPVRVMSVWQDTAAAQQAEQAAAARAVQSRAPKPVAGAGGTNPDLATPGPASEYAQRMQATKFADTAPIPPRFHVQYTIKKGTVFPCTPAAPISSQLPGPVQCTVGQDVFSMDGTTILLPRGTQVNGTIERGLSTGDERLFLIWTDALTPRPDLLAIPLDSPGADEMGQVGAPGDINDHLWKRIKTALLLSAVDIAGSAVTAAAQSGRGNTNLNLGSIGGTAQSMGQMAFGHDLNIPATLYRGPGQPLTVYVNKYIDLHLYYSNRVVR